MNVLGFHLLPGSSPAAVRRAASGAPAVKVCDAAAIGVARTAGCPYIYYRPYLPDDGDCVDGAAWAQRVWQALQQAAPAPTAPASGGRPSRSASASEARPVPALPDAICFRNECSAGAETARQYLAFRATLRTLGYGGQAILGSFGVGKPDWPDWAGLLSGLAGAQPDGLDLHEYWSLSIDGSAPWWALRHREAQRRGLLPPDWPVYIGECGSDAVGDEDPRQRRGWNDGGKLTAEQELGNLLAYQRRCAASVRACFVFADGNDDPRWVSYHTFETAIEAGLRAGWPLNAAPPAAPSPVIPPGVGERKQHVTVIDAIPELNQGPTRLCWAECVQEAFAAAGCSVSVADLYRQVKGVDYTPPGAAATFGELTACVRAAGAMTGVGIRWFGGAGRVNDLPTFDQLLRDGSWIVIVGANEQALVDDLALGESAGYGHYFLCRHLDFDGDGRPETDTIDSYRAYDHVPVRIPLTAVHDAMVKNWDANYDALAFQVG